VPLVWMSSTLQTTNIWLDEIVAALGPDRKVACKVLSVVLHKLRDRLSVELSAHLTAELPLLVRGVYYDQFEPAKQPTDWELGEFVHEVSEWLSDIRPVDREMQFGRSFRFSRAMFRAVRSQRCRESCRKICALSGSPRRSVSCRRPTGAKSGAPDKPTETAGGICNRRWR